MTRGVEVDLAETGGRQTVGLVRPTKESNTPTCYAGSATASSGAVEVATAMLAGVVSTDNASSSGGAHNLPRFLESFGGSQTVAIRGSLSCLYLSGIAVQPWSTRYYGPPPRQWGFDDLFSNGHFPPLTPKVLSFRRVNYTDMSAAQYAAAKHVLYPSEF